MKLVYDVDRELPPYKYGDLASPVNNREYIIQNWRDIARLHAAAARRILYMKFDYAQASIHAKKAQFALARMRGFINGRKR